MIPAIASELSMDVHEILGNTIAYGIPPNNLGKIRFSDVAEAIVAMEKWCWISRHEIKEVLTFEHSNFSLVDELIARVSGEMFPTLPKYPIVHDSANGLFLGNSNSTVQKDLEIGKSQSTTFIRVVGDPEVAARIAIFHTDFGDGSAETQPTIARIDAHAALAAGIQIGKTPSLFYLLEGRGMNYCSVLADAGPAFQQATWKVRLNETLYMEHSDQSRIAAEYLFQLRPQPEVEKALVAYLSYHVPAVRRNVAQALGIPSFKSSVDLTLTFPTIKSILEPVTVQPETLMKVLGLVKVEKDSEVLHWLLCTLTAQFYGGKLKSFIPEVEALTRDLDEGLGEEICADTKSLRKALRITESP